MDILFDVIFGAVFEIFKIVCPNHAFKKWQEILLIFLSVTILLAAIGCFTAGVWLFNNDSYKTLGITLLAVGGSVILVLGGVYGALIGYKLKQEERKNNENNEPSENADE